MYNNNQEFFMHPLVKKFEEKVKSLNKSVDKTEFKVGDKILVKITTEEGAKKRVQTSEGVCIAKSNKGINSSFLIKRVDKNSTMFIRFLFVTENMQITVLKKGKVRRAKLYYIKYLSKKKSEIKSVLPIKKEEGK